MGMEMFTYNRHFAKRLCLLKEPCHEENLTFANANTKTQISSSFIFAIDIKIHINEKSQKNQGVCLQNLLYFTCLLL